MRKTTPYSYRRSDPQDRQRQVIAGVTGEQYPGAFSATDIRALLSLPWGEIRPFGTLAAVSISSHRDSFPVTSMPFVSARGFTSGHRTVAGTLMFNTIDRGAFTPTLDTVHQHPDELPLFDILMSYVNEVGMQSFEQLIGVRILDFGKTVALENLSPIESYSYLALDYVALKSLIGRDDVVQKFTLQRTPNRDLQSVRSADSGIAQQTLDPFLFAGVVGDPLPEGDPGSVTITERGAGSVTITETGGR